MPTRPVDAGVSPSRSSWFSRRRDRVKDYKSPGNPGRSRRHIDRDAVLAELDRIARESFENRVVRNMTTSLFIARRAG